MKKVAILVALVVVVAALGVAVYRLGWLGKVAPTLAPAQQSAGGGVAGSPADTAPAAPAAAPTEAPAGTPPFDGNIASLEWGGRVEWATGVARDTDNLMRAIDGDKDTYLDIRSSEESPGPKEVVLSFYNREPALVDAVDIFTNDETGTPEHAPKDVEVWTSATSPTDGFTRVAAATVPETAHAVVRFQPVEARFVKVRFLKNKVGKTDFYPSEIRVLEAQRAGYTPLVTRMAGMMRTFPAPATPAVAPASSAAPAAEGTAMPVCAPLPEKPVPPGHGESHRVLALGEWQTLERDYYPISRMQNRDKSEPQQVPAEYLALIDRLDVTVMRADRARPWMVGTGSQYDTVVLEQVCGNDAPLSPAFKQALVAWVGAGHKLIIHDSDKCGHGGDVGWLPYKLKTDNPGAQGAEGSALQFIENNWMAHGRLGRPGFIDVGAWLNSTDGYRNELGDSNTVTEWDPHWCGHMAVKNVNEVFGFVQTYARYGRGLIMYGGFDIDQTGSMGYDVLVAREMAQGFDPDNLPCAARLGDFVVTTDARLTDRPGVGGRSYVYPLTLLSNQAYKGTVSLSLGSSPGVQGLEGRFEPASVDLKSVAESKLTVTVPAGVKPPVALAVKGTDTAGKTNTLCLQLSEPRSGELAIVSDLKPNRVAKNLEIILDVSGSMKTALGKKTRWTTALDVLETLLARLPDDFNVGLRMYGHREGSRSPKTCTDSELAVAIDKLDRNAVVAAARAVKPKGETPLVYSVLQAPADLKAVGGGTVIVITDGEESCKGDIAKASADLKASGQNITLNIVGFTLTGQKAQQQLSAFAESTGGRFYSASTGEALGQALMIAAIDRFPYTVFDGAGKVVAGGEAGGGADELPPGTYKVVVEAGTEKLTADRVQIAVGGQTQLRITVKNGRLALE